MHEEDALGKVYDGRLMRRLLRYLAPYKLRVVVAFVLVLAASALKLVGPILTKIAIDDHIAVGDMAGLNTIALLYIAALVLQFVVSFYQVYIMNLAGQRVLADMRAEILLSSPGPPSVVLRPEPGRPARHPGHDGRRRAERALHVGGRDDFRGHLHARRHHGVSSSTSIGGSRS